MAHVIILARKHQSLFPEPELTKKVPQKKQWDAKSLGQTGQGSKASLACREGLTKQVRRTTSYLWGTGYHPEKGLHCSNLKIIVPNGSKKEFNTMRPSHILGT